MSLITFDVIGAMMSEGFGDRADIRGDYYVRRDEMSGRPTEPMPKPESTTHLLLQVKSENGSRANVKLSTGECLVDLEGSVRISPTGENFQEDETGIGGMFYHEEMKGDYDFRARPSSYSISVALPSAQFANLLYAARLGRIPSTITVNARGMTHPYSGGSEWDNKSWPIIDVSSIHFNIPLAVRKIDEVQDESPRMLFLPPTQSQIQSLEHAVRTLGCTLGLTTQSINSKFKWLLALVAVSIAITSLFKL